MPQLESTLTMPVTATPVVKAMITECSTAEQVINSLKERGFACLKPGFTAPWADLEKMMDRLDQGMIDRINSFYNEKKIIKSPAPTDKENIDRKIAFDISPDRMEALRKSGAIERFPELPTLLSYFSGCQTWLSGLLTGLGENWREQELKFNFRMIDYAGVTGSCQPHRDFGLITLIQQSGVAGLKVELEGEMVDVPGESSLLLAGWCLHLLSNGQVPAPLHQVTRPAGRRLSCVTFLAPDKDFLLQPKEGEVPLYRSLTAGDLKVMMAKRWRYREGTLPADKDYQTSQDDFVFKNLKL